MRSRSSSSVRLKLALYALLVLVACGRTTEETGTLRAEAVEIIDQKGTTTMNVADRIRTLEERVQKLEAALEREQKATEAKRGAEAKADAGAAPPSVSAALPSAKPAPTSPWHGRPTSPVPAPNESPGIF